MAFKRVVEVSFGPPGAKGTVVKDLYMTFTVDQGQPNQAAPGDVKIYNLGADLHDQFAKIGNVLQIRAGYEDENGAVPLFTGRVWKTTRIRQQADWISELFANDMPANGEGSFILQPYSCSYDGRVSVAQVLIDLMNFTGMPISGIDDVPADAFYQNGFTFGPGYIESLLQKVVVAKLGWLPPTTYNGVLYISDKTKLPTVSAPLLTAETGLLLEPEKQDDSQQLMAEQVAGALGIMQRYKITTLLMPQIRPMSAVSIKSKTFTGMQWVETVHHTGDNRGGDFRTEAIVSNIALPAPTG